MTPPDNIKKRVLIVESDDALARAFQGLLQDAGFRARTTWSGHEALALVQSSEFDVLLLDNYLPDLHTTEFLKRLSRLPSQPRVVVMEGGAAGESGRHYLRLGASIVVNKQDAGEVLRAVLLSSAAQPQAKAGAP